MKLSVNDTAYDALLDAIRTRHGYDFTGYAPSSVKRRIANFMEQHALGSIDELITHILPDEHQFEMFVQHLSVTVTEMFRDPSFYRQLTRLVFPQLATYPVIKIWLAGCATGQEVYSIAILLQEQGLLERSIIYATDINQRSLQMAKAGIYPLDSMKACTQNYLAAGGTREFSQYYYAQHNAVLFNPSLNRNVVFAPHNLAMDKSFNEFQLIVCRNVLMYFSQQLQANVVDLFHESLCPFGFLGLGDKESLLFSDKRTCFEEVDRKEKIYRKLR